MGQLWGPWGLTCTAERHDVHHVCVPLLYTGNRASTAFSIAPMGLTACCLDLSFSGLHLQL